MMRQIFLLTLTLIFWTTAFVHADQSPLPQPLEKGRCGSANGIAVGSAPTSRLCASGAISTVSGTLPFNGPWRWSCAGSGGGGTAFCSAPLLISSSLVLTGNNDVTLSGLKISSPNGDCVRFIKSFNIVIKSSEIGPCGINNTTSDSRGVYIGGGGRIGIYDNYIHVDNLASGCCDSHDAIQIEGSSNDTIQGNVIAYGEANIEINGAASQDISIIGNFLLNPQNAGSRGQNVQSWASALLRTSNTNITVSNNYTFSCVLGGDGVPCPSGGPNYLFSEKQEDSINFGFTNGAIAQNNYVVGGHSPSGCGIIADGEAHGTKFLGNVLSNTGQCGIGIGNGTNHTVSGNSVLNLTPITKGGNTAIYVWNQYPSACGSVTVSDNIADELQAGGNHSGYWDGGNCGAVTLARNTFNQAAYDLLFPISLTKPPPLIPPQPRDCVATSPYSTQTLLAPCQ